MSGNEEVDCFWNTQPVGTIEQHTQSKLNHEPCKLPDPFEWINCDIVDDQKCKTVYDFLAENYVEDINGLFRFNYSEKLLKWALCPPGYYKTWHIGVLSKDSQKLVAFIGGVPLSIRVNGQDVEMAVINFLCVHKKFRSNRLVPVMIKEMKRMARLEKYWRATFSSGIILQKPLSSCRCWHFSLNPKLLFEVGFSTLGPRYSIHRADEYYRLPDNPTTPGFRKMKQSDIPSVTELLKNHLRQYSVAPVFDQRDVEHWLLPREDVVHAFVVESQTTHEITDFCSFYDLSSSVLDHSQGYSELKAACSYYNVALGTPLPKLMENALIVAKKEGYHVFNALGMMGNGAFLMELNFEPGDGLLHYYLYNYSTPNALKPSELGLVFPSCISSQNAMDFVLSDSSDEYVDDANEEVGYEIDLPPMAFTWRTPWCWFADLDTNVLPYPIYQGSEGTCVAMSIYAVMSAQMKLTAKNDCQPPELSLQHLLNICLELGPGGQIVGEVVKAISREGIVSADDYRFRHMPQVKRYYVDLRHVLDKGDPKFAEEIVKLLKVRPLIAGFGVDDNYGIDEKEYLYVQKGPLTGKHAITLTGFRKDEDEPEDKPVEILEYLNSYGKGFGVNGYGALKMKDVLVAWDIEIRT